MSGISDIIVRATYQIVCTFSCSIGNAPIQIKGTGFFYRNAKGTLLFITNKHNLETKKNNNQTSEKAAPQEKEGTEQRDTLNPRLTSNSNNRDTFRAALASVYNAS